MMRKGKISAEEMAAAERMRKHGNNCQEIAAALDRSAASIQAAFYWRNMTAEQRAHRAKRIREWRRKNRKDINPGPTHRIEVFKPDPIAIADRDYRVGLPDRDLSAAFFGDPKPGYSALDRRT